jgi:hypothetical protein
MSETKPNPKAPRQSRRKAAMEPVGWEEIISQPGMGGYLSFLNGPVPLPHLQPTAPAVIPDPGAVSTPEVVAASPREEGTAIAVAPGSVSNPVAELAPKEQLTPRIVSSPMVDLGSGIHSTPGIDLHPAAVPASVPRLRQRKIRKCVAAQDGHSLGEEILYQALWKIAAPESANSRTIVIGWRGMSQICRMTPKNCKINTQRLIRKLALEVLSPYNTPESIGTTYRIYSDEAVFQRRRHAGMEWVVRSRGVEFVDPITGTLLPTCAVT